MKTVIKKITGDKELNSDIIKTAAGIISRGGLVAFPTETVYGLGGDAFASDAAGKIYAAKGRPSDNPLIVHISKIEDLYELSDEVPKLALKLADRFWPGPLTMIVKKNDRVPKEVTGGLNTVAVRLPKHPVARELIQKSGTFIAAPSANLSGRPSPTRAEHVIEDLSGRVDMIIDGGDIEIGLESTIIDLSDAVPTILRPGYITIDMLKKVAANVVLDKALMTGVKGDVKPKAPGMKYRHYAPKGELTIVTGNSSKVVAFINEALQEAKAAGRKTGVIATEETYQLYQADVVKNIGSREDEESIARGLYKALREFDDEGIEVMYTESFDSDGLGQAVMNRLLKAAGHKVITL